MPTGLWSSIRARGVSCLPTKGGFREGSAQVDTGLRGSEALLDHERMLVEEPYLG